MLGFRNFPFTTGRKLNWFTELRDVSTGRLRKKIHVTEGMYSTWVLTTSNGRISSTNYGKMDMSGFQMSRNTAFPTILHVHPLFAQADQSLHCLSEDDLDHWLPTVCPAEILAFPSMISPSNCKILSKCFIYLEKIIC